MLNITITARDTHSDKIAVIDNLTPAQAVSKWNTLAARYHVVTGIKINGVNSPVDYGFIKDLANQDAKQ